MRHSALPEFRSWLGSLRDEELRFCAARWTRLADLTAANEDDEVIFGLLLNDFVVTVLERSGDQELVDCFFAELTRLNRWQAMVLSHTGVSAEQRRDAERRIALVTYGINAPDWEMVRWILSDFFTEATRNDFDEGEQSLIRILVNDSTVDALSKGLAALVRDLFGRTIDSKTLKSDSGALGIEHMERAKPHFRALSVFRRQDDLAMRIQFLNPYRTRRPREIAPVLAGLTLRSCTSFIASALANNSINLAILRDGSYIPLPRNLKFDRRLDVLRVEGIIGYSMLEIEVPRAALHKITRIGYEANPPADNEQSSPWGGYVVDSTPPLGYEAFVDLLRAAFRYEWPIQVTGHVEFAVVAGRPIVLTGIRPERDELLYFDRKYFEAVSQGSRGWDGGLSLFGFGANLGHDTEQSILSAVQKSVRGKKKAVTQLAEVCSQTEGVQLETYVHLFTLDDQDPSEAEGFGLEVEDQRWQPALLADVATDPEPGVRPFALAYLARAGFRISRNSWGHIRLPVRVFAEVINQSVDDFGFGDANCHLRVRAIAYLAPPRGK